jgi:hypothetical protein
MILRLGSHAPIPLIHAASHAMCENAADHRANRAWVDLRYCSTLAFGGRAET